MGKGKLTISIEGREALPIRAIPYVTSWQESPDSIVRSLAETTTMKVGKNPEIPNRHSLVAYRMDDLAHYEPIPASQWKDRIVDINSLTKKLRADERPNASDENHGPWRVAAILKLPDNGFVWLDEFQSWYSATRPMLSSEDNAARIITLQAERERKDRDEQYLDDLESELFHTDDDSLCMTPIFPSEIEGKIWRYVDVDLPAGDTGGVPREVPKGGNAEIAAEIAPLNINEGLRLDSPEACRADMADAEQLVAPAICGPSLYPGRNSRSAVANWVAWQANDKAKDFGTVAGLAASIKLLAEKWGYESARGKMTVASITRMIPRGLTGGRAKDNRRAQNRKGMTFGKVESKIKVAN